MNRRSARPLRRGAAGLLPGREARLQLLRWEARLRRLRLDAGPPQLRREAGR